MDKKAYCNRCRKIVDAEGKLDATGVYTVCPECGEESVRWIQTITTDALGKRYEQRGNVLSRTRRRLQALNIVGKRVGGKRSRTFELLAELPESTVHVGAWYDARYNTRTVKVVAEECADEVGALADEMREWMSGLEQCDGLAETETYQAVMAAADELAQIDADVLRDVPGYAGEQTFTFRAYNDSRLSRGWARWQRGARAASLLDAAADVAMLHGAGEWTSEARDASMVLEGVDWPTMFGG